MYMYFKKVSIVFLYIMQHLDTSETSEHQELARASTISSCAHKGFTAPVAQSV